eukprot:scaffold1499_cov255-Pinguiococcus_pyrenoidosus.AAC.8
MDCTSSFWGSICGAALCLSSCRNSSPSKALQRSSPSVVSTTAASTAADAPQIGENFTCRSPTQKAASICRIDVGTRPLATHISRRFSDAVKILSLSMARGVFSISRQTSRMRHRP